MQTLCRLLRYLDGSLKFSPRSFFFLLLAQETRSVSFRKDQRWSRAHIPLWCCDWDMRSYLFLSSFLFLCVRACVNFPCVCSSRAMGKNPPVSGDPPAPAPTAPWAATGVTLHLALPRITVDKVSATDWRHSLSLSKQAVKWKPPRLYIQPLTGPANPLRPHVYFLLKCFILNKTNELFEVFFFSYSGEGKKKEKVFWMFLLVFGMYCIKNKNQSLSSKSPPEPHALFCTSRHRSIQDNKTGRFRNITPHKQSKCKNLDLFFLNS